jgi:hypothetical protein
MLGGPGGALVLTCSFVQVLVSALGRSRYKGQDAIGTSENVSGQIFGCQMKHAGIFAE